jgi:transposase
LDISYVCAKITLVEVITVTGKRYSDDFEQQVIDECRQMASVALVARRHELSKSTVYGWVRTVRQQSSVRASPKNENERYQEVVRRLEKISTGNDQLKRIVAEKES